MPHDLEDFVDQMGAEISAEYRRIQRNALEDQERRGTRAKEIGPNY